MIAAAVGLIGPSVFAAKSLTANVDTAELDRRRVFFLSQPSPTHKHNERHFGFFC
jgi:hypothetical protein